jgi:hypothetical protein
MCAGLPELLRSATVPALGAFDLGLSLFYSALLIVVLVLTYLSFSRRNMRD